MRWTVDQVAEALGVPVPAGLDAMAWLAGVSIDSRTIGTDELFIAIRGPRHDGHTFVREVLGRGIRAGVVARDRIGEFEPELRAKLFVVDDTLGALQRLGARACEIWRKAKPGRLVGAVAGSVGKTTTKEILAALVGARFRVLKTQGNLNNEYGLPLTLLKLDEEHGAAVIELGMSHKGELAHLTRIAEPDAGVVTRVAIEHLEFFASLEEIAAAERELIENLSSSAVAILNADDPHVAGFASAARGRVVRFGEKPPAEFRAERIEERGIDGSAFDFVWPGGRTRLELPLIGRHNVMNAVAALAAASVWGVGAEEAKRVFPDLKPADKRGEVVRFEDGFSVINDTYNSSPTALSALVELLVKTPGYQRRILAAGEMLELGASSPELHRVCGRQAARGGKIDWIIGVQGCAEDLVRGAIEAGQPPENAQFFANSQEAAKFLEGFLDAGDLLLLKGSRGVRMERVLEAIDARHRRVWKAPVGETIEAGSKGRR
ncbi:MAG TPA: UDP-N-acetylmuramoyl-tripeptide--D-alanyl-D-alanine ligase [Candidatus Baltobacteraceae bacterium]|nr:UDP-N-acetylmuramoyl-tripeptide--D-alanyl-D-alanine ligase [Candidatus Baltobacteraceae bacterium]